MLITPGSWPARVLCSDFLHQYQRGFTPNPDFLCNHKIKFSAFLQFCLAEIPGVDRIATGHYAQLAPLPQTPHSPRTFGLRTAVDANKDQTYFMAGLSQVDLMPFTLLTYPIHSLTPLPFRLAPTHRKKDVLKHVMFPVGHLSKPDVVALAREAGLHEVADQRESMGICFIGKRRFGDFISEYLAPRPGRFVTRDGDDLGGHMGHFRFTRGQCAHIPSLREKHFVADKCAETNTVIVVPGRRHPALYTTQLAGDDWRWSCSDAALLAPLLGASSPRDLDSGFTLHCQLRTRHRMPLLDCTVALPPGYFSSQPPAGIPSDSLRRGIVCAVRPACSRISSPPSQGPLEVTSAQPVRAVTPGQIVALYKNGFCIAGGTITSIGPSLADLGLDLEAGVA